ncbi:MAG: hypothetical protein H0T79_22795 [Deltaproteobacteria bacterium]|nr:hypothetical protein [Deltaproteobacteria bacterium]
MTTRTPGDRIGLASNASVIARPIQLLTHAFDTVRIALFTSMWLAGGRPTPWRPRR